jgi:hypothetical protein
VRFLFYGDYSAQRLKIHRSLGGGRYAKGGGSALDSPRQIRGESAEGKCLWHDMRRGGAQHLLLHTLLALDEFKQV